MGSQIKKTKQEDTSRVPTKPTFSTLQQTLTNSTPTPPETTPASPAPVDVTINQAAAPPINPPTPAPIITPAPVVEAAPAPTQQFTPEQEAGIAMAPKPTTAPVSISPEEEFARKQGSMYKINQ